MERERERERERMYKISWNRKSSTKSLYHRDKIILVTTKRTFKFAASN